MPTKIELISDIELRLSRGKPSDEFEIPQAQIAQWIDNGRAKVLEEVLRADPSRVVDVIVEYKCQMADEDEGCYDDENDDNKYFIKLPAVPMALSEDLGVFAVETANGNEIIKMHPKDKFLMKHLKYANPSLDTPAYYRLNDKIYFEGGNDLFWDNGKINIWLVPADTKSISDLDDYPVPSDMIALILEHAETVGMRELQTLKDIVNDGDQPNLNEQ